MHRAPGSSQAPRGGTRGTRDWRAGAAAAAEVGDAVCSVLSGFGKMGDKTRQTHIGQRSETGPGPLKRRLLHQTHLGQRSEEGPGPLKHWLLHPPRGPLLGAHWAPVPPWRVQDQEKPAARWGDASLVE